MTTERDTMSPLFTLLSANTRDHLALVKSADGGTIRISWDELKPYCAFANPPRGDEEAEAPDNGEDDYRENEYAAIATVHNSLVVCLSEAQGQGGIVAVRDLLASKWVYIAEAAFIQAALPLFEHGMIVMLVCINVPYVGSPVADHRVWVAPLDEILDGFLDRSRPLPIKEHSLNTPTITKGTSVIFKSLDSNGETYGLIFDTTTKQVYAGDGPTFSANYSIAELQHALTHE